MKSILCKGVCPAVALCPVLSLPGCPSAPIVYRNRPGSYVARSRNDMDTSTGLLEWSQSIRP